MPPPLDGIRVLDLTRVLAGPYCVYQLALMGADIIKVEQPGRGDLARQLGADTDLNETLMGASFLAQNGGKKSITLDLKKPEAEKIFRKLVESVDVLVENYRPGVMDRLGFGFEVLKTWNSRLIYCAITGFGQSGPLAQSRAYDQIIQGMSGVMSVTGDKTTAPTRVGYPVCDTTGGMTGAFAIACALTTVSRTGQGLFIDVSMLDSTLASMGWVVSNKLIAGHEVIPMGNDNATASPSGTFRARDGVMNIAANEQSQFEALCQLIGRAELIDDPRFADRKARKENRWKLTSEIESAMNDRSVAEWCEAFAAVGVPCGPILTVTEALEHPHVRQRKIVHSFEPTPLVDREISVLTSGFKISGYDIAPQSPPPTLGENTDQVLEELGYSEQEINAFRERALI
ncbi:MAG: CaiB/BaiF CoA transferase family protein [Alphaproteobacteria bacterium]